MRVSVLVVSGILLSAVARAQVGPVDADGDGVVDGVDQCEETPAGDLVDSEGCSVCPCEETAEGDDWASHEDYVRCVAGEAKRRRLERTLRRKDMRAAIKRAKRATCGNPALTVCCVYASEDDEVGQCRVLTVDRCDALWEQSDNDVEDMGPGSCQPNPCAY